MGGRSVRKEPNYSSAVKKLTSTRLECVEEVKKLMECMTRQGLADADAGCARQRAAAAACMAGAVRADSSKAELDRRLRRMVGLFKRFGFK